MKKIALINMNSIHTIKTQGLYPIGLTCIETYLKMQNIEVEIIDFLKNPEYLDDFNFLNRCFDFIAFSIRNMECDELNGKSFIHEYNEFIYIVKDKAKEINPNVKFILGGAGYSIYSKCIGSLFKHDYSIIGPGEHAICEIIRSGDVNKHENTSYIEEQIFKNTKLQFNSQLIKAYLKDGFNEIGIPTVKGKCKLNCIYCSYKLIEPNKVITRDIKVIKEEIQELYKMGVRRIFFTDSVFNTDLEHSKKICKMISELNLSDFSWSAYVTPFIDEEFMQLVSKSNCKNLLISFDSFSQDVIDNLKKGFNINEVKEFIKLSRKYKIDFKSFLMFGGIGETEKSVIESCEFANKYLNKDELCISFGMRIMPQSGLSKITKLEDKELLIPKFFPFDEKIYEYVLKNLDSRFLSISKLSEVIQSRNAYRSMKHIEIENYPYEIIVPNINYIIKNKQ